MHAHSTVSLSSHSNYARTIHDDDIIRIGFQRHEVNLDRLCSVLLTAQEVIDASPNAMSVVHQDHTGFELSQPQEATPNQNRRDSDSRHEVSDDIKDEPPAEMVSMPQEIL